MRKISHLSELNGKKIKSKMILKGSYNNKFHSNPFRMKLSFFIGQKETDGRKSFEASKKCLFTRIIMEKLAFYVLTGRSFIDEVAVIRWSKTSVWESGSKVKSER